MPAVAIKTTSTDTSTQRKKKRGLGRFFKSSKKKRAGDDGSASVPQRSVQFASTNATATAIERGWTTTTGQEMAAKQQRKLTQQQQQQQVSHTTAATDGTTSTAMRQSIFQTTPSHKAPPAAANDLPKRKPNWLARTKFFQTMVNNAFNDIDADGSNDIDEKELYSGLLLIHLQMGAYAGPAACKPISREKCHAVFTKMDVDGSGRLDKDEFSQVMMVLFGNVMMRVLFQYAATLMIVPLLAQKLLDCIRIVGGWIPWMVQQVDPYTPVDEIVERYWNQLEVFVVEKSPEFVRTAGNSIKDVLDMVPDSVWSTVPLTLLSTLLSMMIIPWTLMKIDDYFQSLADKEKTKTKQA